MKILFFTLLFLCLLNPLKLVEMECGNGGAPKIYRYLDGSGNKYEMIQLKAGASLEYVPMKPEFSSSGTYDGGEPWKVTLSEEDFQSIVNLLVKASKDESQQSADRNMGGGTILLPKTKYKDFYLKMDSADKTAIENKFKSFKVKYIPKKETTVNDTLIVEGIFVGRNFVEKKDDVKEFDEIYFEPGANEMTQHNLVKQYFVELSKCKVTKEQIQEFMGRPIRARILILKGFTHQSRYGDYVIVFDLID